MQQSAQIGQIRIGAYSDRQFARQEFRKVGAQQGRLPVHGEVEGLAGTGIEDPTHDHAQAQALDRGQSETADDGLFDSLDTVSAEKGGIGQADDAPRQTRITLDDRGKLVEPDVIVIDRPQDLLGGQRHGGQLSQLLYLKTPCLLLGCRIHLAQIPFQSCLIISQCQGYIYIYIYIGYNPGSLTLLACRGCVPCRVWRRTGGMEF